MSEESTTMWEHLQNAPMRSHCFGGAFNTYWGRFVEKLARKAIKEYMTEERMQSLFPDVEIISSERWHPYGRGKSVGKLFKGAAASKANPDSLYILHIKRPDGTFGKYAVAFEIKYGASHIDKDACDFWREFVAQPDKYIKKCDMARIYMVWVHGVDDPCIFYTLKEIIPRNFPPDRNE